MTEKITCKYVSDEQGEIGLSSEVLEDDGSLHCTAEADDVLRPVGSWHLREFGPRVPFCRKHAEFLRSDAQAEWEMIDFGDVSTVRS